MTVRRRTYEDELQTVTSAVINVLHSLTEISASEEVAPDLRIEAAYQVLEYARKTVTPFEEESEAPEGAESEGEEGVC